MWCSARLCDQPVLAQSDMSVQHRLMGQASELTDLLPCVVLDIDQLPVRRYLNVENGW